VEQHIRLLLKSSSTKEATHFCMAEESFNQGVRRYSYDTDKGIRHKHTVTDA
jgi:hypothetical protein